MINEVSNLFSFKKIILLENGLFKAQPKLILHWTSVKWVFQPGSSNGLVKWTRWAHSCLLLKSSLVGKRASGNFSLEEEYLGIGTQLGHL